MKFRALFLIFICIVNLGFAKPKLVVNIVVGQMRYDYLLRFKENFSDRGFVRLLSDGISCERAMYNYLGTTTPAGLSTISTGANPSTHGVVGTYWYNYSTAERVELIHDSKFYTVGSDELDGQVSPRGMIASTLGDALKAIYPQSKVLSVGFEPTSAVLTGGYSADAVYWLNPREGNMVSSSYYQSSLPGWVEKFNGDKFGENYSAQKWVAYLAPEKYRSIFRQDITMVDDGISFDLFTRKKYDYERLKNSPFANTLLKEFATQLITNESLGKGENTDLLNIVFDPMRLVSQKYGTQSIEVEDSYYRMDALIGELIDFLEYHLGKENFLMVLTSDHGAVDPMIESSKIPSGRFNSTQFTILINGFVGGLLGEVENWILDYSNNQIYLNRRLMMERNVDITEVQNKIAAFAIQFRGVAQAITSTTLQNSHFSEGIMSKAQNAYNQLHSGDIIINLLPGWAEESDRQSDGGSSYNYDTHVPLLWYGGRVGKGIIERDVDMADIAPTIAHLIGIAPPNAATGKPIIEIYSTDEFYRVSKTATER